MFNEINICLKKIVYRIVWRKYYIFCKCSENKAIAFVVLKPVREKDPLIKQWREKQFSNLPSRPRRVYRDSECSSLSCHYSQVSGYKQ